MSEPFNYGNKVDGMYENHPTLEGEELVRPVRVKYKHMKCGEWTWMGEMIAKTYAIDPGYYTSTFCAHCRDYYPVGEQGQFNWEDGTRVGT